MAGERGFDQLLATLRQQGVRRIPVVDDTGRLEGVVSLDDLLPLLADPLGALGRGGPR